MEKSQLIEESLTNINSSPVECLNEVLRLICETAGCEYGAILTLDGNKSVLALDALYGYRSEEALEHRSARLKFPLQQGWIAAASLEEARIKGAASRIVKQILEPGRFPIVPADVKEVLAYPVTSMGEYIAVLTLGSRGAGAFDRAEDASTRQSLLQVGSNLISVALASRQSLIFKLDEFIKFGEFNDIDLMSKAIVRWVLSTFKMDSCALFFVEYDEKTDKEYLYCKVRIVNGQPESNVKDIRYSKGEDYCGWVEQNCACLILTDFEEDFSKELESYDRRYGDRPRRSHAEQKHTTVTYKSYLGIPIIDAGRVIGVLEVLDTERGYAFSDEGLLEMIGQRIAYEYNRILEKRRRENLFAIPGIEERDLDKVVDEVVTVAMNVAAATHGFFLYKESDDVFIAKAIKGHALKESDIPPVRLDQPNLVNYVLQSRDAFIIQDIDKDRSSLPPELQDYLNDGPGLHRLATERFKSLLMVPIYEPAAGQPAGEEKVEGVGAGKELGVLVLMSSRPSPFKQDELVVTALAEIVGLHIWGNKRLAELDYDRRQVAELREAAQNSQQAILAASASASASAGTVHSAKKHIDDIAEPFNKLINHQAITTNKDLLELARQIHKPFQELRVLYDRLHLMYAGAEPKFSECDISQLVQEVRAYMESTIRERNIVLNNNIHSGDIPKVKADDILMKVVFINLIRNSIEANARKITVSAKKTTMGAPGVEPRDAIEVSFRDDGFGIPRENWKDIFSLFFTAHKKGGSGVGLAVNRSIMNKHNGKIRVLSSAVGEGTTITLVWPIDPPVNV